MCIRDSEPTRRRDQRRCDPPPHDRRSTADPVPALLGTRESRRTGQRRATSARQDGLGRFVEVKTAEDRRGCIPVLGIMRPGETWLVAGEGWNRGPAAICEASRVAGYLVLSVNSSQRPRRHTASAVATTTATGGPSRDVLVVRPMGHATGARRVADDDPQVRADAAAPGAGHGVRRQVWCPLPLDADRPRPRGLQRSPA